MTRHSAPRERVSPRVLSTAEERREEVLPAAMKVMGARGLYGTPTLDIARAAGISQAYVFRLFPTKLSLFVAVVERSFQQIKDSLERAARAARPLASRRSWPWPRRTTALLEDPESCSSSSRRRRRPANPRCGTPSVAVSPACLT